MLEIRELKGGAGNRNRWNGKGVLKKVIEDLYLHPMVIRLLPSFDIFLF